MNKKRLLKLADLLAADAKNKKGIKFDLDKWAIVEGVEWSKTPETIKVDCGTRACAVGLACLSGAFKRSGLTYEINSQAAGRGGNIYPKFKGHGGFIAVEMFFEIDEQTADWLFLSEYYEVSQGSKGERAVEKRIRNYVAGKERP